MSMTRREFIATSGVACALAASASAAPSATRPNILLLHADDYAQWAVGAYGNSEVHTPHVDALARQGILFSSAMVSTPVCSPARANLMTGLDSLQHGIKDWIRPQESIGLEPSFTTFPELLKRAGYETAYVGKWHLGKEPQYHPLRRGFDHFMGFLDGGNKPLNPTLEIDGETGEREGWLVDMLTDDAAAWLGKRHSAPFLCMVSYRNPHMPYTPVQEQDQEPYRGRELKLFPGSETAPDKFRQFLAQYYACCTAVDRSTGRLLAKLDELGLADNTLVVFTGDNGYMVGQHGMHTKGNGHFVAPPAECRPNMFDPSLMVPLVMRWPGVIEAGARNGEMVGHIDFLETFCDVAGVAKSDRSENEGRSLLPLTQGQKTEWRDAFYGSYDQYQYKPSANLRMVRTGEWKLVRNLKPGGQEELYHLSRDPGEVTNLAGEPSAQEVHAQLAKDLAAWQRRVKDPLLT